MVRRRYRGGLAGDGVQEGDDRRSRRDPPVRPDSCPNRGETVFRRRWGYYLASDACDRLAHGVIDNRAHPRCRAIAGRPHAAEYLSSQPAILLHYLRLAVLPDQLCFDYQWPVMRDWTQMALPGAVILGLFAAAVVALVTGRGWDFLAASCFVVLAPTSSIQPITDLAVEHRMYLPLALLMTMGVLGFTATIVRRVLRLRRRRAIIYAATLLRPGGHVERGLRSQSALYEA